MLLYDVKWIGSVTYRRTDGENGFSNSAV